MSSPFSRTLRSLDADSFSLSLTGLICATVLLAAWLTWFFTARIVLCETSAEARVTAEENVVSRFSGGASRARKIYRRTIFAVFPPEAVAGIRPGQPAAFYPDGQTVRPHCAVPAVVTHVTRTETGGRVELATVSAGDAPNRIREGLTGQVRVEISYVSPANLVTDASGLFVPLSENAPAPRPNLSRE